MLLLLLLLTSAAAKAAPAQFAIVRAGIHQTEDGELAPAGATYIPGETLFFSFEVEGFQVSPQKKVQLAYQIDVFDPSGLLVIETAKGKVDTELSPEDKQWKPRVRQNLVIPTHADPGTYKISATVKDELSGAMASKDVPFVVRGHEVATSDSMVVRNFRFLRSEEDREPLAVAAYRPGDTVWARFDITGYKIGEGNQYDVEYGISVSAPSGKLLFSQEKAQSEKGSSFYRKRYLPEVMSLTVQPGTQPGVYTLTLIARDLLGNQTYETKQTFQVEK